MKGAKRTPVPLPGPSSKAKLKANHAPVTALSQEYVESDDDSSNEMAHQPKPHPPKTTIAIHTADGKVKSKSKSGEEHNRTLDMSAPKKLKHNQNVILEQSKDLSGSKQRSDRNAPSQDMLSKSNGGRSEYESPDESDSDSNSVTSSSDASMEDIVQSPREPAPGSLKSSQVSSHAVALQPAQPYTPPQGFTPLSWNEESISRATDLLQNLKGKKVWHITAPVGVSLKDFKELVMSEALNGDVVLSSKGAEYRFTQANASEDDVRVILVPSKDGYQTVPSAISQTLHLQETIKPANLAWKRKHQKADSETRASITRSTIRAPRPQVTGLQMRFLPIGFGGPDGGILGDSDDEGAGMGTVTGVDTSNESNLTLQKEKRKHIAVHGGEGAMAAAKKSKKHRMPEDIRRKEEKRAKKEKKRSGDARP